MAELIAGRYELGERIGSGGMAEVFRAHDHQLDRTVAIKIMNRGYTTQPAFVERFRREAQAAASLDHPAIVPIYDWGETNDSYYIVMAYVAGQTLRDTYRDRDSAPLGEVLGTIATVASGLQHAHDRGIVHRDIKPQNILIDQEGNPRITDFGIARAAGQSSLTETSVVLGTATYISPEQATRRPTDARSDIYSLGVVTYEILAGRPPFQGESIVELAMQHVHEEPPSLRGVRPDIPAGVEQIVMTCLAKDPDQRIQTAEQLSTELNRVREDPSAVPLTAPTVPVAPAAAVGAGTAPTRAAQGRQERPRQAAAPPPRARSRSNRPVWVAIAIVGVAVIALLALLMNQFDGTDDPNTGVVDGDDAEQTNQEGEGAAPEATEDAIDDEPAPENPGGDANQQPTPENTDEPEQTDDAETQTEPQEDVPPDDPPADAPGQQENSGNGETPPEAEGEGDEESAQPQSAAAELPPDGVCDGTYQSIDVSRVLVPGDGTCSLSGGRILDEVVIEAGGTFQASGVEILNDLQADQAGGVDLGGGSYVDGNIQYNNGGAARIADTTVEGNLQFDSNPGTIEIDGTTVDGNVQVTSNSGGVTITNNQIDGNLECADNDPPPTGGGNSVTGDFENQCAGF